MSVDSIQAARPAPSAFRAAEANPASKSDCECAPEQDAARSPQQLMQLIDKLKADVDALLMLLRQGQGDKQQPTVGQDGGGGAGGKPGALDGGTAPPTNATGNKALIDEINRVRKEHGLNPVKEASNLNRAAAQNDAEQQTKGIGHHVDLGKNGASGEIAFMASNGATPQNSVQGWLDSAGHRKILLDPNLTKVGAHIGGQYSTADFS